MESASHGLAKALSATAFSEPQFPIYANVTAEPVRTAARATELILEQLAKPVRWSDSISALSRRFPQALYVEMGPGSVLVGLTNKIAPSVRTATCGTASEAQQLRALVNQ